MSCFVLYLLYRISLKVAFCLVLIACFLTSNAGAQTGTPTIMIDETSKEFTAAIDGEDAQWYVVRFDNFPPDQAVTLELDDSSGFFSLKVFDSADEYSSQITIQPGPDGYLRDTDISVRYTPGETGEHTATILHKSQLAATKELPLKGNATSLGPLPVDLISFSAQVRHASVVLDWKTAPDSELTHFLVEVSLNPKEGFNSVITAPCTAENSSESAAYQFIYSPGSQGGTHYFRIGQVYSDNSVTYSRALPVEVHPVTETSTAVSPNPFNSSSLLTVTAVDPGKLKVTLCNLNGTEVLRQEYDVVDGENNLRLNTYESMPSGIYILTAELNGTANKLKLIKQ